MDRPWLRLRGVPRPPAERFWEKVDRSGNCWLWRGASTRSGYGAFGMNGSRAMPAHRAALVLEGFQLAAGDLVLHRCDTKLCVRPNHLYVGTFADNNRDTLARNPRARRRHSQTGAAIASGLRRHFAEHPRSNHEARKTHCPQGHAYDAANTGWSPDGRKRYCRTCNRERHRRHRIS